MTTLERNALARAVLSKAAVETVYCDPECKHRCCDGYGDIKVNAWYWTKRLCESHERLRMEGEGYAVLIADLEAKLVACHELIAKTTYQNQPDYLRATALLREQKAKGWAE
jgi:hypothetical protein